MTQKEINEILDNTKVYVNGKSKEIQEKLFSFGYSWNDDSSTDVCHTEAPFLFIYEDTSITMSSEMDVFCDHENSEITAEEILSLELTEPDYRPFKDAEECWQEMLKHQPFGWVKYKNDGAYLHISCVMGKGYIGELQSYSYKDLLSLYTLADGTPLGIKEE